MDDPQIGACGHLLPPGVRFCPQCGQPATPAAPAAPAAPADQGGGTTAAPVASPPPVPAWQQQPPPAGGWSPVHPASPPAQEWLQPGAPESHPPRNARVLLAVALVLVVLGGGGFAAYSFLGGGGGAYATYNGLRIPLDDAVTSEPEQAWSWDSDDGISSVSETGDGVVLVTGSGEMVRLDADGEEVWTTDTGAEGMNLSGVPGHEDVVIGVDYTAEEIRAFSTEDGDELWSKDSAWLYSPLEDGLLVASADTFAVLDLEGEELWTADGAQDVAAAGDTVYVLDDGELSRRAATSGEEDWTIDVEEGDEESSPSVVATEEMVVVSGAEVVAYDTDGGDELWSADGGPDGADVMAFSESEVVLAPYDWSDEGSDTSLTVYDTEGEVTELETSGDDGYHFLLPVHAGSDYVIDDGTGAVYDAEHELLARHDGEIFPADGGLYLVEPQISGSDAEYEEDLGSGEADVSFVEYADGDPLWEITVEYDGYLNATTRDGLLVLFDETEVTAYK